MNDANGPSDPPTATIRPRPSDRDPPTTTQELVDPPPGSSPHAARAVEGSECDDLSEVPQNPFDLRVADARVSASPMTARLACSLALLGALCVACTSSSAHDGGRPDAGDGGGRPDAGDDGGPPPTMGVQATLAMGATADRTMAESTTMRAAARAATFPAPGSTMPREFASFPAVVRDGTDLCLADPSRRLLRAPLRRRWSGTLGSCAGLRAASSSWPLPPPSPLAAVRMACPPSWWSPTTT